MKNIKRYINTMYFPAFVALSIGLALFSIMLCALAINLRADILSGKSDMIYRYPQMIEKIVFPLYILLPVTFVVDMNERKKKS